MWLDEHGRLRRQPAHRDRLLARRRRARRADRRDPDRRRGRPTLNGNPEYGNLPRKFKITITGCQHWCSYPEINDIGVTAVRRADRRRGLPRARRRRTLDQAASRRAAPRVRAAGAGRSTSCKAITAIFRDSDELRVEPREGAHEVSLHQSRLDARSRSSRRSSSGSATSSRAGGRRPARGATTAITSACIRRSRPGLHYAGFSVVSGRISPEQLRGSPTLADEFGDGTLRLSAMQNILDHEHPERASTRCVAERSRALGVPLDGSPFQRGTRRALGASTASSRSPRRSCSASGSRRSSRIDCPASPTRSSCTSPDARTRAASIRSPTSGSRVLLMASGVQVEGFDFFVGGESGLAQRVGFRAQADDVPDALEGLFERLLQDRWPGEHPSWTGRTVMRPSSRCLADRELTHVAATTRSSVFRARPMTRNGEPRRRGDRPHAGRAARAGVATRWPKCGSSSRARIPAARSRIARHWG